MEKQGPYDPMDADAGGEMMGRFARGMTISLVRQGPKQTKVKVRFDNVYYPRMIEECFKIVWLAVDKQMFLDKELD